MADMPEYEYNNDEEVNNKPNSNPSQKIMITEQNADDLLKMINNGN